MSYKKHEPLVSDSIVWKEQAIRVLAELSHSMRNPFSTIQSYLNILEMEDYNYSPQELKEITFILRETVEKSFKTIEEKIGELRAGLAKPDQNFES